MEKHLYWPSDRHRNTTGSALLLVLFLLILVSALLLAAYGAVHRDSAAIARFTAWQIAYNRGQSALIMAACEFAAKAGTRASTFESIQTPYGVVRSRLFGAFLWMETSQVQGIDTVHIGVCSGIRHGPVESYVFQALEGQHSLVLANEGQIEGAVRVGRLGVKAGQWEGQSYEGRLPEREDIDTTQIAPTLWEQRPAEWFETLVRLRGEAPMNQPRLEDQEEGLAILTGGSLGATEFHNESLRAQEPTVLRIAGDLLIAGRTQVWGPIEWIVDGNLTLTDSCQVQGSCFWVAGATTISGCAVLRGQVLSRTSVTLTDSARILESSLVWVHGLPDPEGQSIAITDHSSMTGTVIQTLPPYVGGTPMPFAEIGLNVTSSKPQYLSAYLESYTKCESTLIGELFAKGFLTYKKPTTYLNWLVFGRIRYGSEASSFPWPFTQSTNGTPVFAYAKVS